MNPEIKARWLAALRSGEYRQARNFLERDGAFCCLGVLCNMAHQEGAVDRRELRRDDGTPSGVVLYGRFEDESRHYLPNKVTKWAGLDATLGPTVYVDRDEGLSLASLNDSFATFAEIADIIETRL